MDPASLGFLILLCFLFLLSAFFSSSETAIFSLSELKIKNLVTTDNRDAAILDEFLSKKETLLIGILLGNTVVNVAISFLITKFFSNLFTYYQYNVHLGMVVAIPLATVMILVFGEILPKTLSFNHRYVFALWIARPLNFFLTLFSPFIKMITFLTHFVFRLFGIKQNSVSNRFYIQKDKIFHDLSLGEEMGSLDSEENEMLSSVCTFGELVVKNIMTPRTAMTCISANTTLEEILEIIGESSLSRFPVFKKDLDEITGILHAKELIIHKRKIKSKGFHLEDHLMPCFFIPENKKVEILLKEFQKEKTHLAIVVDEYGGTSGLVTLEDILEEIVGDMAQEDDADAPQEIIRTRPNGYVIEALTQIDEICDELDIELPRGDYETLGGLVYDSLGRIPEIDEEIELKELNITLKVLLVEGQKIRKIFLESHAAPDSIS